MGASLKSQGYPGFHAVTGSIHSGDASTPASGSGIFMWSGSKQLYGNVDDPAAGKTDYFGVGLEAVGNSESYFRFRTKTGSSAGAGSELDVRTDTFFLGSSGTFISGSGDGTIAITSSNFHLEVGGDITMAGTITAEAGGTIGGWSLSTSDIYSLSSGTPGSSPNAGMVISTASGSNNQAVIKVYDGTDVNAALGNYASGKFGVLASEGSIGGWELGADYLEGENIIMSSTGSLQTKDFQDGITTAVSKGWKISEDGTANFASARIRGTLSTAVFEKETISAVGGAAIIANATCIASGSDYSSDGLTAGSSTQTLFVDNAGGFAADEWLLCKATSSTGFVEEFMKIVGTEVTASPHSMTVTRGMAGDFMAPLLTPGQVLVSQGKDGLAGGTGYILLNATSGSTTPYIDIVERTGNTNASDLDIKVRLGDLSGINDPSVGLPGGTDTFGLYTDNVYLKGVISASAGNIGGWTISSTALTGGTTSTTIALTPGTGIHMGAASFASAPFSVTNAGVLKSTSGEIGGWTIGANDLSNGGMTISAKSVDGEDWPFIAIGAASEYGETGIWMGQTDDGGPYKLSLVGTSGRLKWSGSTLFLQTGGGNTVFKTTSTGAEIGGFNLSTTKITDDLGTLELDSGGGGIITVGDTDDKHIILDGGDSNFRLKNGASTRVRIDDDFFSGGSFSATQDWGGIEINNGLLRIDNDGGTLGSTKAGVHITMENLSAPFTAGTLNTGLYVGLN
jgi:hypothetical protein